MTKECNKGRMDSFDEQRVVATILNIMRSCNIRYLDGTGYYILRHKDFFVNIMICLVITYSIQPSN